MYNRPGDELLSCCAGAQHLFIAAPYIKANALTKVLDAIGEISSLTCVTRWNPHDLAVGASDTKCRTIVKEHGGAFKLHPSLHAKYYRMDDDILIGSANLTFAAMGWSAQTNTEIICRPGSDFDAQAFQQKVLNEAREISDDEFLHWEAVAKASPPTENPVASGQPLLDTWRPATRDPKNMELAYQGREDEIASFDEQRAAHRDIQALQVPPGLNSEQVRMWVSACLLAAPFAGTAIRLRRMEAQNASRLLADAYGLSITEARRDMETVQNWLTILRPDTSYCAH